LTPEEKDFTQRAEFAEDTEKRRSGSVGVVQWLNNIPGEELND
jgi:hypothetical protein